MAEYLKSCQHCQSSFVGKIKSAMYCSQRCRDKVKAKARSPRLAIERPCEECGTPFRKRSNARFCSDHCCWKSYHAANADKRRANTKAWKKSHPDRVKALQAKFKAENADYLRDYWRNYSHLNIEKRRVQRLDSERRRNASKSLSLLLMPMHPPSQEQTNGLSNLPDRPIEDVYGRPDFRA